MADSKYSEYLQNV